MKVPQKYKHNAIRAKKRIHIFSICARFKWIELTQRVHNLVSVNMMTRFNKYFSVCQLNAILFAGFHRIFNDDD